MTLTKCQNCQFLKRNSLHNNDQYLFCTVNPSYALMWKYLRFLDQSSLLSLPIDDCPEFKHRSTTSENFFSSSRLILNESIPNFLINLKSFFVFPFFLPFCFLIAFLSLVPFFVPLFPDHIIELLESIFGNDLTNLIWAILTCSIAIYSFFKSISELNFSYLLMNIIPWFFVYFFELLKEVLPS